MIIYMQFFGDWVDFYNSRLVLIHCFGLLTAVFHMHFLFLDFALKSLKLKKTISWKLKHIEAFLSRELEGSSCASPLPIFGYVPSISISF